MNVREAVFSGSWYPESAKECEKKINGFLKTSLTDKNIKRQLTGGIVPHASWYFSGDIACNVINCLKQEDPVDAFIIYGMHLGAHSDCYIMKEGLWETPFGNIEIDENIANEIVKEFDFNIETTDSFTQDNTIEVNLPFLKYFFENAKIVPIGMPPSDISLDVAIAIAKIIDRLGLKVKVLGSTDLTHYGYNYRFTPKGTGIKAVDWVRDENDRMIIDTILEMDCKEIINKALSHNNACCPGAAAAAVMTAKQLGSFQANLISYSTSYEKSPGNSFVGYAGIVF